MTEELNDVSEPGDNTPIAFSRRRLALLAVLLGLAFTAYTLFGDELAAARLNQHEQSLRSFQQNHPVLIYALLFLSYVLVSALAIPLATALTFLIAWLLGFWEALLLISFASTAGATVSFLLSRYIFRDAFTAKFGKRLERFNTALEREGAFYLFALRLNFAVPFFVVNAVAGLTPMRVRTFWWVSQIGMLTGSTLFVYVGTRFPSLGELATKGPRVIASPEILIALALLGLFPFLARRIVQRVRRSR